MKIIGGHDYYDSAQAFGHDPNIVFTRDSKKVPGKTIFRPYAKIRVVDTSAANSRARWIDDYDVIKVKGGSWLLSIRRVIFCGKMYIGVKATWAPNVYSVEKKREYFWERAPFEEWLKQFDMVPRIEPSYKKENNHVFSPYVIYGADYDYLIKNRIAVGKYNGSKGPAKDDGEWTLNGTGLRDWQFYRLFDAVQTFQNIDMWMGTLGLPGGEMLQVSDSDRMAKHGMDKWSFRNKVR